MSKIMKDRSIINVFVSSTSEDLKKYRAVARDVVGNVGWHPVMMEDFGAIPDQTVQACCEKVDQSDVVLLIVAFRRGWVPTVEQGGDGKNSVTAFELARAREKNIPVLAMLARDDTWPGKLWEEDADGRAWVKKFRGDINRPAAFFDFESDATPAVEPLPAFRAKVRETLLVHKARLLEQQRGRAGGATDVASFERSREVLLEGTAIPFLGMALYRSGRLSPSALGKAIARDKCPEETRCLATAAEYRERFLGSRELFLNDFRQLLETAVQGIAAIPVYDLIVGLDRAPPLIVSATYDPLLERRLEQAKQPFITVAHVLRSYNGTYDGKILVVWEDKSSEFCDADKLDRRDAARVIYKPLGSPFLHANLDPELEIDTVVVTEADHLVFLSRLENQLTGVPNAFARLFQRRPLLFLGYPLDVWHYRLVMQVFQSVGPKGRSSSALAVRVPDTPLEEMAWKRLGADLVRMDLDDFAQSILDDTAMTGQG